MGARKRKGVHLELQRGSGALLPGRWRLECEELSLGGGVKG